MVSKRTEELIKSDEEHVFHPFGVVGQKIDIVFEEAQGTGLRPPYRAPVLQHQGRRPPEPRAFDGGLAEIPGQNGH